MPPDKPTRQDSLDPPRTYDEKWTEGDIELISSDNVVFRIDSLSLMCFSNVFREMMSGLPQTEETRRSISLTDPTIESAAIIRIFLILREGQTIDPRCFKNGFTTQLLPAIEFLNKYDCRLLRQLLAYQTLVARLEGHLAVSNAFAIVANLNDALVAKRLVHLHFAKQSSTPMRMVPYETYKTIPKPYLYALERANDSGCRGAEVANIFETQLNECLKGRAVSDVCTTTSSSGSVAWTPTTPSLRRPPSRTALQPISSPLLKYRVSTTPPNVPATISITTILKGVGRHIRAQQEPSF